MPRINQNPSALGFPASVGKADPITPPANALVFPGASEAKPSLGDQLTMGALGSAAASLPLGEPEPQFEYYTVKRGDTLGKIAQQMLGNAGLNDKIYEANKDDLMNPNNLVIGMKLKIPVLDSQSNAVHLAPKTEDPKTAPAAGATDDKAEAPEFSEYTVKRGESLSIVALKTLDDSERYMEIFNANRDQLSSPDALQPGMTLKIPNGHAPVEDSPRTRTGNVDNAAAVDASGLTAGATELLDAMKRYQQHHAALGHTGRTQTTPAEMREIAIELDAAGRAFDVDPKLMLALFAHESGGINPDAKSHTGAGGLGQLTGIAIRQVHHMSGIAKGYSGRDPFKDHKSNFVQSTRSIQQRFDIKANVWTSTAYMSYELKDRANLGRGVERALKRYGDPNVSTYANKVNAEYKTLFGGSLF